MRNVRLLWGIIGLLFAAVAALSFIAMRSVFPHVESENRNNPPSSSSEQQHIVAVVGNKQITAGQLQSNLNARYGNDILNQMLDQEVVRLEAEQLEIKVSRSEIDNELKRMQQGYDGEAEFYKAMKDQLGMTKEQLREDVYYRLLLEKIAIKDVPVRDEWVDEYIRLHPEEFKKPAELKIQQIIVGNQEQANKVLDDLKKGADFAGLAKDRSLDDATRNSGGDLGWVEENDPFVPAPVLKAAKGLKKGEVSKPFELAGKYAMIKLNDRKEQGGETADGLHERVRKELALREAAPLPEVTRKLREKWKAQITDPEFGT
ncbi:peptidylprolyl isomerase [Paenibacillus thalictri]|uniref:peptidylprolyl isomerase n=1 Tax=Paenibacillus thalictri TaxID=2527873 RepID=A0A4Q9DGN0_9BACL|nr:peptidylprolyl isomerase [Paenibacillus thalictri]TBL69040.1 peptidylprolyl isomerase [Paenibacillus thalictri]